MSGVVDELGPEVTGIKKGDRVAGVFLFTFQFDLQM